MIYVMSDIHGNMRRFRSVMEQINLQPEDTLYVLGDVIDRFPYGIEILQELMAMPNVKMLLGNHEYMMLNAMDGHYVDTGLRISDLRDALLLWYDNDGWVTQQAFLKLDPREREDIFAYLRSLPLFYEVEIGDTVYRLIHAAPMELFEAHRWNYRSRTMFTVWYRWPLNESIKVDCTVIFGHTPTYYFAKTVDPMRIFHGEKRIGIDCGSGFPVNAPDYALPHGRLACLRLDDLKEFYSEEFLDPDDTEYTDKQLEALWDQFADIPMDPETERMEEDFLCFPIRTHREEIWHWFDERHSKGVYYLLYERASKQRSDNRAQATSHERGSDDDGI